MVRIGPRIVPNGSRRHSPWHSRSGTARAIAGAAVAATSARATAMILRVLIMRLTPTTYRPFGSHTYLAIGREKFKSQSRDL